MWALVLLSALAVAGAWVLALPTRGRVSLGVAAVTGVVAVLAAAVVVVSLDALVFNRVGFFHFDLPVTETFPVLAVHPGPGLVLGLVGLLLQAAGGWTWLRQPAPAALAQGPYGAAPAAATWTPPTQLPPADRSAGAGAPAGWPAAAPTPASAPPVWPAAPQAGPAGPGWQPAAPRGGAAAAAFGQGPPPPRRHRRR